MTGRDSDLGPERPLGAAGTQSPGLARELLWLNRRRDLLRRAIAEMEHDASGSGIRLELVSNVPELLGWARSELARIELRIARIDSKR